MRRRALLIAFALVLSLISATSAQAVVVTDHGGTYGVALVSGTRSTLAKSDATPVTTNTMCLDPALPSDFVLPSTGLCSHSGPVMHGNATFALTWDPLRRYWQTTRNYVEQYLSDVANGSGSLSSAYAVTTQYTDQTGRAGNASSYGGGCIDYGATGGSACDFSDPNGHGAGHDYPSSGCPITGSNGICLTDSQLQSELTTMISQTGLVGRVKPGYTPLVVLLTPSGIETCLDSGGKLCSANGSSAAKFCSYHSQVTVNGTQFAYAVQPWTAGTACDDPNIPQPGADTTAQALAIDAGARLVSPLSQAHMASITNPWLNSWYALDGSEINDNGGCAPILKGDSATVGSSSQNPYLLQPEFSNAGLLEHEPNAPSCALGVALSPQFVLPSAAKQGDVVQFDGSTTVSSLIVPGAGYSWNFGDGSTAAGPSVVHTFANGGTYTVALTVTDRGGNVATLSQQLVVSGPPVPKPAPQLQAHIQLLPQSMGSMLRSGIALRLTSSATADGIATLTISRATARQAHIPAGHGADVVIGRGTVSGVKNGTIQLHLRLPNSIAGKLGRLHHITVTVRLSLVATGHLKLSVVAAGRY